MCFVWILKNNCYKKVWNPTKNQLYFDLICVISLSVFLKKRTCENIKKESTTVFEMTTEIKWICIALMPFRVTKLQFLCGYVGFVETKDIFFHFQFQSLGRLLGRLDSDRDLQFIFCTLNDSTFFCYWSIEICGVSLSTALKLLKKYLVLVFQTTGGPQIVRFLSTQGNVLSRKPY